MNKIMLNGQWDAKGISPEGTELNFVGSVPGSALNDLLMIEFDTKTDVFWRDNADKVQKYEKYDWEYVKTFNLDCDIKKQNLYLKNLIHSVMSI